MMNTELAPRYDASLIESKWYAAWEGAGLFKLQSEHCGPTYTITIPPPNITGSLHMGHSLCYPIQDLVGRYKRLRGFNVVIVPGQDHAGIATQSVVAKQLKAEGVSLTEIGREGFNERTWAWRKESGDTILKQFRLLGCAFDWSQSRFTLDERYVDAVLKVFIDWYRRGIIYRGKRVVNWDPVLRTSVSDIETVREEINGKLYHVRYPFADGSGEVIVATTRPETMLGDVAAAVHPSDARYKDLVGKRLTLPLTGREIPLISDIYPDPEFGTGVVKITPAHDANDFEVGRRHNLDMPVILDETAHVSAEGPYFGLNRVEARKRIVHDLEEQGFLVKVEDHRIAILKSDRSGEVIEPLLSEQWFARQTEIAEPAIEAVKSGRIEFVPERYAKVYTDWLEGIRDWNIGRQLWWGHRVPVYYTEDGTPYAALSWEDAQNQAGEARIVRQDDDVLDTWFSSGLWPFAVQGWPEDQSFLQGRYPTDLLVTDRGIIYLWVARMAMMSLDFIKDIPFKQVYIHATVMNQDGKRMSKSLGTGVDPTEVISKIGADSLRFTLLSQAGMNQEIRYSEKKTEDARNFCNKIWNAVRFFQMNLGTEPITMPEKLEQIDRWILSRLAETERIVREAYEGYDVQAAAQQLYQFFWSELCDWYIEITKSRFGNPMTGSACRWTLLRCFEAAMKMLHPIMPFITEEVYSTLPIEDKAPFIMSARWPSEVIDFSDPEAEEEVERWFKIVRAARAMRADLEISPKKQTPIIYVEGDLRGGEEILMSQSWFEQIRPHRPTEQCLSSTVEGVDLHIPVAGLIDVDKLKTDVEKLSAELVKLDQRLANPEFISRAKPEVVTRDKEAADELRDKIKKLQAQVEAAG